MSIILVAALRRRVFIVTLAWGIKRPPYLRLFGIMNCSAGARACPARRWEDVARRGRPETHNHRSQGRGKPAPLLRRDDRCGLLGKRARFVGKDAHEIGKARDLEKLYIVLAQSAGQQL